MTGNLTYAANLARLEDPHRQATQRASRIVLIDGRPRRWRWSVRAPRLRPPRRIIGVGATG